MKRIISAALLLCLSLSLMAQGIGSGKQFVEFIKAYNAGADVSAYWNADSVFVFTADIDLTKEKKVPQIVTFGGKLDGCGFSIKGFKSSDALIGEILEGAQVKNITFDQSCVLKTTTKTETALVGMLAKKNCGIVSDCATYGTISHKCTYTSNPVYVGGLVGSNNFCMLRCASYGKVESACTNAQQKADLAISVGGIVGGTDGRQAIGATVAWCNNYGSVSVSSDFPAENVGGIVGQPAKSTVKFCVNYGKVSSSSVKAEEGNVMAQSRVGGIAGLTKSDIACCDNRGEVFAEGSASAIAGGIVGQPHFALNVTDCVNYGSVNVRNENVGHAGGIAGSIGRGVHVRRCFNRGQVIWDGVSARDRSTAGGVVGNVYFPKSSDQGTYIRNCANYGSVSSSAGGNNYAGNDHSIHAGGVVGYMEAREGFKAFLYDCKNEGTVKAASGRRGSICANVKNITTGGAFPEDDALMVAPLPDGTNVSGKVAYADGTPASGVVVTDGELCVETDKNGFYSFKSDLHKAHFIYLSIPSYTMTSTYGGVPRFFKRVSRDAKAVQADFVLEKIEQSDKYTVLMIGDPQVRPFGVDNSMERWTDTVSIDAEQYRAGCEGGVYCINLGDLVYNFMTAYDDYLDAAAQIKCPTFNVIGNHDYDQATLFDTQLGNMYFESYISPEHYSFNIGKVHFVCVNTIMYDRTDANARYGYGLDDRTMAWLENDLRFVDKDRVIVACSHAQLFKKRGTSPNGSHSAYNRNYNKYRDLLSQYKEVYSWSGHYHDNSQYNYKGRGGKWGADNIQCITVSRATGALRLNEYLNSNGTPQGYMVVDVDGDNLSWWYKSVGKGKDYQMRAYDPSSDKDGYVKVNIWNYGDHWTTPEWWENGRKVADMEYHPGVDPAYQAIFDQVQNKRTRKYCTPSTECDMFRIKPSEGCHSGEIRVKDQFGNEYKAQVNW